MKHILPVFAVALAAVGCMNDRDMSAPNASGLFGDQSRALTLEGGRLRGDFGPRTGFDGAASELQGATDLEWMNSTVLLSREEEERGTGMIILWTHGVALEDLEVGTHRFTYDERALEPNAIRANVCSGSSLADIDYDRPANDLSVEVTEVEEGRRFDIHTSTERLDEQGEGTGEYETSDARFVLVR